MELRELFAFNTNMDLNWTSHRHWRLFIALLLTLFSVQSVQAVSCCDINIPVELQQSENDKPPCHGDEAAQIEETVSGNDCCQACVSVAVLPGSAQSLAAEKQITNQLASKTNSFTSPELPYRPPNS